MACLFVFPFSSLKNMVTKQSITYSVVCFPSLTLLVMEKIMAKTSFRSVDLDFVKEKKLNCVKTLVLSLGVLFKISKK